MIVLAMALLAPSADPSAAPPRSLSRRQPAGQPLGRFRA